MPLALLAAEPLPRDPFYLALLVFQLSCTQNTFTLASMEPVLFVREDKCHRRS